MEWKLQLFGGPRARSTKLHFCADRPVRSSWFADNKTDGRRKNVIHSSLFRLLRVKHGRVPGTHGHLCGSLPTIGPAYHLFCAEILPGPRKKTLRHDWGGLNVLRRRTEITKKLGSAARIRKAPWRRQGARCSNKAWLLQLPSNSRSQGTLPHYAAAFLWIARCS